MNFRGAARRAHTFLRAPRKKIGKVVLREQTSIIFTSFESGLPHP